MAYDYEKAKKQYEQLNDEQKQQFAKTNSGYAQDFLKQYNQEKNNQTPTSNESNFNNQNGTNGQNSTKYQTPTNPRDNEPRDMTAEEYRRSQSQVSPDVDTSKFNEAPGQISVKEGTAAQTGKPDYSISTDARLNEMKGNLDQYFKDSPRMFSDRETFNRVFDYNNRESDAQRQLLDSYWKRKEDMDKASTYTSGEAINNGMKNGEITTDQLNLLKEYNPEAYQKWQQLQEDEIMKRIVNDIVPKTVEEISGKINSMIEALGIQAQDALDIEGIYNDTMAKTGAYQTLEDCNRTVKQIEEVINKKTAIMNRYANSTGGTVSDALAAARMAKAIAPYNEQLQGLQYQYQDYSNLYSQKSATAYQAANVRAMQAQENQRIWNQKCSALGFATSALSYRTPEEQAQLQLQTQQAQNEIQLLQQSRLNDLNRYNTYATTKMQNQLQAELTDLSVEDEQQLKANLNNVLSDYYKNYGDIIQRSQAQVVDDVIAYAKKNGISVAQALSENFIKPLQNKAEYKNMLAKNYPADTTGQQSWTWVDNGDGTSSLKIQGVGQVPDGLTRSQRRSEYKDIYEQMGGDVANFSIALSQAIKDGNTTGWCGEFVNDYLVALGLKQENGFGDYLDEKMTKNNRDSAVLGGVAIMDFGVTDENGRPYGHVGIIVGKNPDGSLVITDSNRAGDKTKLTHTLTKEQVDKYVKGYYNPNLDLPQNTQANNTVTDDDIYNYNDATLNRKLTSEQRQKVMDAKNEVYSNPDSSMEDILRFSQGGKTPTDSTVQSLDKYAQALTSLGQLTDLLKDANTGPIIGTLRSNNPYDVKAREINTAIAGLLPTLARGVYGEVGVLTDKDIEHYSQTVPNLKSTSEVNDAILAMSLDMLADGYKRKLATQASLGYDVSGMAGLYQQIITKADELMAGIGASDTNTTTQTQMTYTPIFKTTSFQKYK